MSRPTPSPVPARVIGPLVALTAAVWVAIHALLTPAAGRALQFVPEGTATRVWTLVSYPFVHGGPVHLGLTMGLLALTGPAVVRQMGARRFLLFYLYCAVGAGLFAFLLSGLAPVQPLLGALGPALGVTVAFGWYADDAALSLQPAPGRVRIRALVGLLALGLAVASVAAPSPALSFGHLGGLLAGWGWFRLQAAGRRPAPPTTLPLRRAVMTPVRREAKEPAASEAPAPRAAPGPARPEPDPGPDLDTVNRLLDKISRAGLASLTRDERRLLDEYAERKRREDQ